MREYNDWLAKELRRENYKSCTEHQGDHVYVTNAVEDYEKLKKINQQYNRAEIKKDSYKTPENNDSQKNKNKIIFTIVVLFFINPLLAFVYGLINSKNFTNEK